MKKIALLIVIFAVLALSSCSSPPADADTHYYYDALEDGQTNSAGNRYSAESSGVFANGPDKTTKKGLLEFTNCVVLAECLPEETWKDTMYTEFKVLEKLYGESEDTIRVFDSKYYNEGDVAVLFLERKYIGSIPFITYTSVNKEFRLKLETPGTDRGFVYTGKTDYGWSSLDQIRSDVKSYAKASLINTSDDLGFTVKPADIKEAEKLSDVIQLVKIKSEEPVNDYTSYYAVQKIATVKGEEYETGNIGLVKGLDRGGYYYIPLKKDAVIEGNAIYTPFAVGYTAVPYDSSDGEYIRSLYGDTKLD